MQPTPLNLWAFTLALVSGLYSPHAMAHGDLDIGGFYQGIATVVLHWEQALFLLVGGLWCAQQTTAQRPLIGGALLAGIAVALVATIVGLRIEFSALAAAGAYTALGLAVASQFRRCLPAWVPLALLAGLSNGLALGSNEIIALDQPMLFSLGLLLGASMLLFYVSSAICRLPRGWPWIGVRIAGSWAAAVGLMVSAFALTPGS